MPEDTVVTTPDDAMPSGSADLSALSKEEKRRRFEDLRKRMGESKFRVVGEPGVHYFWAPKDDSNEMVRLDMLGYAIVREPNASGVLAGTVKPKIQASGLRQDGTYVVGDVILTQCDQDVYDYLMLDNEQRADNAVREAKDSFILTAAQDGVPAYEFQPKK